MIAHNIVHFCIFNLLKYDRIFSKNLDHDAYGVKWNPWQRTLQGGLFPEIYVSFYETYFFK